MELHLFSKCVFIPSSVSAAVYFKAYLSHVLKTLFIMCLEGEKNRIKKKKLFYLIC